MWHSKLSYLLRCIPPPCISSYAAEMDNLALKCASNLLDISKADMSKSSIIQQLQSPVSYGFGLISALESSPIAYLSSVVSCLSMPELKDHLRTASPPSSSPLMLQRHLDQYINTVKEKLIPSENRPLRADLLPSSVSEIISHYEQHRTIIPILHSEVTGPGHQ